MLANHGDKTAVTFGNQTVSYGNLMGKIEKVASIYELGKGEHAVIFSENRPGWFYAFYSIWYKSGIAIPVDYMATADETAFILADSTPSIVFVSSSRKEIMEQAISSSSILTRLIVIDDFDFPETELVSTGSFPGHEPDQTAVIIYTSGTTGLPKGVMLSYTNILTNIKGVSEHIPIYNKDSRVMVLLPLHHIFPLMGSMIAPLYTGGLAAICPSMTSDDIINTLKSNKITIIIGVPRLYSTIRKGVVDKINKSAIARFLFAFAKKANSALLSKKIFGAVHDKFGGAVKYLVSGGAALDPEVGNDFKALGFEVLEGYGMTELAPMITFTRPGRVVIGSPGEVLPGAKIRIVDGEITVSGPNVMKGYYNRPGDTAEVIKDGWLHTGDLGYMDEKGYLFITGRKKEIIVLSNGKKINPVELEDKIIASSLVKECGVFSYNDQVNAVIVPSEFDEEEGATREKIKTSVIAEINSRVSPYKKITRFYLSKNELPRTRLGKLQRYKLIDFAATTAAQNPLTNLPETSEYKLIAGFIQVEKEKIVEPGHHFDFDLGMDSLDKVGLQVYLKQNFGVEVEAGEISKFGTVGNLAAYVSQKKTKLEDGSINWADIIREKINFKLPESALLSSLAMRLSKFLFKLYFRYKAKGLENIPAGPCIITPNHQSFFDGLFVTSLLKTKQIRKTYFYAKADHVKMPLMRFLARKNNVIVVDLNRNLKESIQKLAEALKNKKNIIIFPEGTRSTTGYLGQFKKTFAILSRELNVPVVPVRIQGAIDALPKGSIFPRPWKKISVEFLQPIYPGKSSYEQITEAVKLSIQDNLKEAV